MTAEEAEPKASQRDENLGMWGPNTPETVLDHKHNTIIKPFMS